MSQLVRRMVTFVDLASTAAGGGASLVALADSGGHYPTDNAEAAFQQLAPAAFKAPWFITKDSEVLTSLRHATSGAIVQQWQNGAPGTANYFYRGLSVQTDSHAMQMGPASNGGAVDLLFQRSTANADPAGNRFNITFGESSDRLDLSFATSASGAPAFDSFIQVTAGPGGTARLDFPALVGTYNLGVGVKQRAAGGFEVRLIPTNATNAEIKQIGGAGTTFLSFRDGAMGFFGSSGTSRPNIVGSRGGNAALGSLLTFLDQLGLVTNGTTT